jgi:hypothetical protein
MKTFGKYTDCSGKEQDIDMFHMHGLIDRVHVISRMFNDHVTDHPAAILLADDIEEIARKLRRLYQKIGDIEFRT